MLRCLSGFYAVSALAFGSIEVDQQAIVYGKYHSNSATGQEDTTDNTYWLYRPAGHDSSKDGKLPVILQIHGGGFTGGQPFTSANADIESAVSNGIAYVSVGYRLVGTKYYYGSSTVEELINVDAEGRLALDKTGKTMDDYKIRRGRQEYNTKCSYDAVQMIEHLIAHADEYGLDIHRISTTGGSAGGGEIHYLTWVYHQWNVGRYTPVGMVYTMAQLDYPVQNMMDRVWGLWADDVGNNTKLSTILQESDCSMIVGNPWCDEPAKSRSAYNLCNKTWTDASKARFCGDKFASATLGALRDEQVWPRDDPEVGKGMEVLWYNSINMQKHAPKPFYLYIANQLNSTQGMNVVHNSLYGRNYAKYAEKAGINYTVYYTDYHAMTDQDKGDVRISGHGRAGEVVYNYRSSHDWIHQHDGVAAASSQEQLLFHCMAFGIKCDSSPSPSPGPSPSPEPANAACKKAIDAGCPTERSASDCTNCIHANARAFMAAGCPSAKQGGAQTCINYCEKRTEDTFVV